jgi:hypothetical protein
LRHQGPGREQNYHGDDPPQGASPAPGEPLGVLYAGSCNKKTTLTLHKESLSRSRIWTKFTITAAVWGIYLKPSLKNLNIINPTFSQHKEFIAD